MSTDLAKNETETGLATVDIASMQKAAGFDEDFSGISGQRMSFLPRLQLFTSGSEAVKRGKISLARYGLIPSKDELVDLGPTVLVIPVAWRPKAMNMKVDPPLSFFKKNSPEFQEIKKTADEQPLSGCMYGPEYLMWLNEHGFCTFFMGSKTARNEAPAVQALLPDKNNTLRVGLLSVEFIETTEYSWHGARITLSAQSIKHPSPDELAAALGNFLNPRDSKKEEVATAGEVATQQVDR